VVGIVVELECVKDFFVDGSCVITEEGGRVVFSSLLSLL